MADPDFMPLDFVAGYVIGARQLGASARRAVVQNTGARAGDLHDVNERIDRLTFVVRAMWSLLEELGIDESKLQERLAEMDAADGDRDGLYRPAPRKCAECESAVAPGLGHCQFCGREMGPPDPFASV